MRRLLPNHRGNKRLLLLLPLVAVVMVFGVIASAYGTLYKYDQGIVQVQRPLLSHLKVQGGLLYDAALISANAMWAALDLQPEPPESELKAFRLRVAPGSIQRMAGSLPESAKAQMYKAKVLYEDGTWRRAQYRFRGRNFWHWHPEKPSLRVKLRRGAPINLQRHINFVNPEDPTMVSNYYGELVALDMGVLAHHTEMVRLYVNDQYMGVYQQTTREDESLLRLRQRMPGPLFVGSHLKQRWAADDFEVRGEDKPLRYIRPMEKLTSAMYLPLGVERYEALWEILDFDKMARWQATMNVVGGTHSDYHHNHLFYFDPTTGLLEPGVEDLLGHGAVAYPGRWERFKKPWVPKFDYAINEKQAPLLDIALRDPRWNHRRNQLVWEAINGPQAVAVQRERLEAIFERQDSAVAADKHKSALRELFVSAYRVPYSNGRYETSKEQLFQWLEDRDAFLRKEIAASSVRAHVESSPATSRILLEVDGNASVTLDISALGGAVTLDRDLDGRPETPASGTLVLHPGFREDKQPDTDAARNDRHFPDHFLRPAAQRYLMSVAGPVDAGRLQAALRHALTGEAADVTVEEAGIPQSWAYNEVSIHPWRFPHTPADIHLGPGEVIVTETLRTSRGQGLTVAPGTTLKLAPGVSIAVRGPVRMVGTADAPIVVERSVEDEPWGVVAIHGPEADGSRVEHVRMSGGSRATLFDVQYSGMLSVHWVGRFDMKHSRLSSNVLGDDTYRCVHSHCEVEDLVLEDCFGDCLDYDYGHGTLQRIVAINAGNDAFDFMTSTVTLKNSEVRGAGDKGVSAGEASTIDIEDTKIRDAILGMAVKDKSVVHVRRTRLEKNFVAIDVTAKNWRYGGSGRVHIHGVDFIANQVDLRMEDDAVAQIAGQDKPERIAGDGLVELVKE